MGIGAVCDQCGHKASVFMKIVDRSFLFNNHILKIPKTQSHFERTLSIIKNQQVNLHCLKISNSSGSGRKHTTRVSHPSWGSFLGLSVCLFQLHDLGDFCFHNFEFTFCFVPESICVLIEFNACNNAISCNLQ